ncbi:AI-2E family transporter [Blautia liquoris]|uniref:AI-2E family transporter n=1 Tax=Blautia liquoris TaxID=2779518 RepID=A0A7M2RDN3_9FIRM|nr:AI-2E family transporter [Blautia liquoris]QOV18268.1 AI-2E family transporter [Blautia liquoris]
MNLDKKTMHNIEKLVLFTVLVVAVFFRIDSIWSMVKKIITLLSPFLLGMALAFVINVLMTFIEHALFEDKHFSDRKIIRKIKRPVSLVLTIVCIFGIIYMVSFVVIPQLGTAVTKFTSDIQTALPKFQKWIYSLLKDYPKVQEAVDPYLNMRPDWESIINRISQFFVNGGTNLLGTATAMAGTVISSVASLVISFIFACYILIQKEQLGRQSDRVLKAFLPEKVYVKILDLCTLSHHIFSKFIAGQCLEACILGSMFFVVLTIGNFPYALLISVMVAFTALIPIFGAWISCFIGAFLILTESPISALAFIIVFQIVQQIENNFIYPKVVGTSIGLPSIWVLAAVTLGGSLFGIAGMLIFIPFTSVVYTLLKNEVSRRLENEDAVNGSKDNHDHKKKKEKVTDGKEVTSNKKSRKG